MAEILVISVWTEKKTPNPLLIIKLIRLFNSNTKIFNACVTVQVKIYATFEQKALFIIDKNRPSFH